MKPIILYVLMIFLTGCGREVNTDKARQEMIDTDIEFSNTSVREGMAAAFVRYADNEVVLLRDKKYPIIGIDSLKKYFSQPNSDIRLEWKPWKGEVSQSGDLGYTIGNWKLTLPDTGENVRVTYGNYVSIWKKTPEGWRYVLDGGNSTPDIDDF